MSLFLSHSIYTPRPFLRTFFKIQVYQTAWGASTPHLKNKTTKCNKYEEVDKYQEVSQVWGVEEVKSRS